MRDRMADRLIHEPRIRRHVRPRATTPPSEEQAVPAPRVPARDEHTPD